MKSAPYLLSLPALLLFGAIVIVPLVMTVLLSFHDWGQYKGIEPVFILKNWHEIVTDPYYAEMFGRTFRIAILTTLLTAVLGAPEAYILNRMSGRWKSVFLLVILGPLLISVVARTLGWALLFGGNNGLVNKLLMSAGLIRAQGGDPDAELPTARESHVVAAPSSGTLTRLDALDVGMAAWRLGAGRARKEDPVQAGAGVVWHARPGDQVTAGQPLFTLLTNEPERFERALASLEGGYDVGDGSAYEPTPVLLDRVG